MSVVRERLGTTLARKRTRERLRLQDEYETALEDAAEEGSAPAEVEVPRIENGPQSGPQYQFLESLADIAIYGGSAGSGKTFALLLEPMRHVQHNDQFSAVIFRRTTTEIRNPGGLWDESMNLYGTLENAKPSQTVLEWHFDQGGKVKFAHLEYDSTVMDWHSAQVPLICYDELTTFTRYQFFYMLSRNRSMCGIKPYIRATCNPDAASWVAEFIAWWIDQKTGLPIPERSGVLRYFVRAGERLVWADSAEELTNGTHPDLPLFDDNGAPITYLPLSVTFIGATIYNNRKLLQKDPTYLAKLQALDPVERARLLGGNWKIRPAAGLLFKRQWCEVVDECPPLIAVKRGWDLAATEPTPTTDPDYTASTKIGKCVDGRFIVLHYVEDRLSPQKVEKMIKNIASADGVACEINLPQDPGQAGKSQAVYHVNALAGFTVRHSPETGDKVTRFSPFSAQAEKQNVLVLRGPWNERFFEVLEGFPDMPHDDGPDATSRAFNAFFGANSGLIDYLQNEALKQTEAARIAKEGEAPANMDNGGVRVIAPAGVNILYDAKGRMIHPQSDGTFIVTPAHAKSLTLAGFTLAKPKN